MRNLVGKCFNLANRNFAIKTNMYCLTFQSPDFRWFRSHWLSFAHIGSVSLTLAQFLCNPTRPCVFVISLFVHCTVLTVRSAAPQTALRGGPGPRFELGTGERHWPLNTTASPSIILILCGLCQVCSAGAPGRVQPGWPAAGRVGNSLFGFSCESLVFFYKKEQIALVLKKVKRAIRSFCSSRSLN